MAVSYKAATIRIEGPDLYEMREAFKQLQTLVVSHLMVPIFENWLRAGAGIGVVHDFALPAAPELVKVIPDHISLSRSFWLIRHEDDGRSTRLNRFADLLVSGCRKEMQRLESLS